MNKWLAKLFGRQVDLSPWAKLSKEKPTENRIYPVWCFDCCWAEWTGINFVDRYGIVKNVTYWMR